MSYILDALRRADAERERGAVPGLHTQQFGALPSDDEPPPRPRLLIGAVVVLALALAGALAWHFLSAPEPSRTSMTAQVLPAPVAAPAVLAPPPSASAAPAVVPPAAVASTAPPMAVAPLPRAVAPKPVARPAPRRETSAAPMAAAPGADVGAPGDRVYTTSELPDGIRRELPKIAFGGASYSPDRASRMVILNGQVFHEGDTVAPGLVLRQVRQKSALLVYKGYRWELGF